MSTTKLEISFPEANLAEASVYAQQLRDAILDSTPDVEVVMKRPDPDAQDAFGTALLVEIIAGVAVEQINRAIDRWWSASEAKPKTAVATNDKPPVIVGDKPNNSQSA